MARPRNPLRKAKAQGRNVTHPSRYKDRKEPEVDSPLGDPPEWMGGEQRAVWKIFQDEIPWLDQSHRTLVEIATSIRARMTMGEEVGVQALNLLRQCLGQMGATPSDASKIILPEKSEETDDLDD